jgi:hypothetical protein
MLDLTLAPTTFAQQMACTVICKVQSPDEPEDPAAFLAGEAGARLPTDLEVGATVWSRQDGDANMLTLVKCSKRAQGSGVRVDMELSVIKTQGCTETTSFQIIAVTAFTEADIHLPCSQFGDRTNDFPVDPPSP